MAEVEVGGVKFRGGKIAIILTALSSLGGAMWGGFEFYKDYMDMREKIESYTAPDLSGFDKRLAVLTTDMSALRKEMAVFEKLEQNIQDSADAARDEARTIKRDLKVEIVRIERISESMDRRIKAIQDDTRKVMDKEQDRFDTRREAIRRNMDALETETKASIKSLEKLVTDKIKKALENPLSQMRQ